MNKDHQRPQSSPASIADLWEHACLLFHSFEWQSAIHTFLELEQDTSDPGEKCIFALNRGLIEARLGDLDLALISFFKALRFEGSNSVAHFLLGLVCAETGNYADGLMHFEHCLKSLDKNARTYRTSSGYFQLGQAIVVYNAERLRLVVAAERTRGKQIQPRLQTIPAQIIFEAPLRATETSMTDDRASTGVLHNIEPHIQFDERVRDPINQALQPTYASGHNTQSMHLVGDQDLNLIVAPGPGTQTATSPRMKLSPRDARTSGESMREISQFLRHAGPSGDSTVTVDRKYMQSLLQGSNGNSTPRHVRGQLSTSSSMTHLPGSPVSRDSDFHSLLGLYIGSPRMRRSFPLSSGTPSPTSVVYEEPMGIERSPTNVVKSPTTPHARRPSLAERWLRKEVSPALVRRPSIDQSGGGTGHQISRFHVRTASADDGESLRSAPSVVSSMQFLQVGGPLRRPGL